MVHHPLQGTLMVCIMLLAQNEKERQILTMAFEQLGAKVVQTAPSYSNYVKVSQYEPDIILIDFPKINSEQIHFVTLVRKNEKMKSCYIIGYGNHFPHGDKQHIIEHADILLERPLKFSLLLKLIETKLKPQNKSLQIPINKVQNEKSSDLSEILNTNTLPMKKVELIVKHISSLLAFPFTVAKVLKITEDSKSGAGDLSKIIKSDSVISTNVLRIANTVFYASRGGKISAVKDAIIRIGFVETKKIVMTMSVMELFDSKLKTLGFNRMDFWHYSLACAIIAENIGKRSNVLNSEELFLAGLLHGFGIILWDEFFPQIFQMILQKTTENGHSFFSTEKEILYISQHDVIEQLFKTWKISDTVTAGICKYEFIRTASKWNDESDFVGIVVFLSSIMAKGYGFGTACDRFVYPLPKWMFSAIKMTMGPQKILHEAVSQQLDIYKRFLSITTEPPSVFSVNNPGEINVGIFLGEDTLYAPIEYCLIDGGFSVKRIMSLHQADGLSKKFHIFCLFACESFPLDHVKKFLALEGAYKDDKRKGLPVAILAFVKKGDSLFIAKEYSNLSVMTNEFDIRTFIMVFERVLAGEQIFHE